jgi:ligand-binding SRPBCC domain-containing protein
MGWLSGAELTIRPMPYLLTTRTSIPLGIERVFAFFSDANNLQRLTPPWLHFRLASPAPTLLSPSARLDYRLRLHGWPIRWQSEITEWDPPQRFVDEQRRGPYRWWIHTHTFTPDEGGTVMEDVIDYQPRGGALVHAAIVGRDLRRIFTYRSHALREALGLPPARADRIVVARR